MEVHYCKICRSRVSSFDIDSGAGKLVGRDAYCRKCAKELDKTKVPSPAVRQLQNQEVRRKQTPAKAEPATKATRVVPPHTVRKAIEEERELPSASGKKSSAASILFLLIFIAVIGALVYGLYQKKHKKPDEPEISEKSVTGAPSGEETGKQENISNGVTENTAETEEKHKDALTEPSAASNLIPPKAEWRYLAGSYAKGSWTEVEYDDSSWKKGRAGFGYGDDDDQTVLKNMENHYTIVYIRRTFEVADPEAVDSLFLKIKYDDGFVAYINTREVARSKVRGSEKNVKVESHESKQLETFPVNSLKEILKKGVNVLAIEGHNRKPDSSDFTLDPYLRMNGQ